ncbi:uncharacterized protein [Gossypium hirsutum]|uniref:Uncharacterized protein isoform X3 n=2 Tax=Gossypium hirsutum TaxID=3635 RepID=A0A1U8J919_GOSHI|nr:uncharacterized protein LOC107904829 isoform X3 [Gossypium hirsutum]
MDPGCRWQSRKMWRLSSTSELHRGHLSFETTLLILRLTKFGIKSQEIRQIVNGTHQIIPLSKPENHHAQISARGISRIFRTMSSGKRCYLLCPLSIPFWSRPLAAQMLFQELKECFRQPIKERSIAEIVGNKIKEIKTPQNPKKHKHKT